MKSKIDKDDEYTEMVKMHISIKRRLLADIDRACDETNIRFRSTWITLAINEKLKRCRSQ